VKFGVPAVLVGTLYMTVAAQSHWFLPPRASELGEDSEEDEQYDGDGGGGGGGAWPKGNREGQEQITREIAPARKEARRFGAPSVSAVKVSR
jgi:hypothetical protein